jgi:hypothetical protein
MTNRGSLGQPAPADSNVTNTTRTHTVKPSATSSRLGSPDVAYTEQPSRKSTATQSRCFVLTSVKQILLRESPIRQSDATPLLFGRAIRGHLRSARHHCGDSRAIQPSRARSRRGSRGAAHPKLTPRTTRAAMSWNEASTPQNNGAAWPPRYDTVAIIYHGAAVLRATTLWLK